MCFARRVPASRYLSRAPISLTRPTAATTLLMLLFGIRVLMRRVSRVSGAFFALTIFAAIWFAAFTMMYLSTDAATALRWSRLAYFGVPFLAPAIYQFSVEMLRVFQRRRLVVWGGMDRRRGLQRDGAGYERADYRRAALLVGLLPALRHGHRHSVPAVLLRLPHRGAAGVRARAPAGARRGTEAHPDPDHRLRRSRTSAASTSCRSSASPSIPSAICRSSASSPSSAYVVRRYDLVPITPSLAANEIINTMADVLFVCDRDGRIQFANRAAGAPRLRRARS